MMTTVSSALATRLPNYPLNSTGAPKSSKRGFGESGGIGRLDDDGVVSPCDPIAERALRGPDYPEVQVDPRNIAQWYMV